MALNLYLLQHLRKTEYFFANSTFKPVVRVTFYVRVIAMQFYIWTIYCGSNRLATCEREPFGEIMSLRALLAGSDLCIQRISFAQGLERFFSFVPLSALGCSAAAAAAAKILSLM